MEPIHAFVDSGLLAAIIDLPEELRGREVEIVVLPPSDTTRKEESRFDPERPLRMVCNPGSLLTEEERAEARRRREMLAEEFDREPRMSKEEWIKLMLAGPVATDEEMRDAPKSLRIQEGYETMEREVSVDSCIFIDYFRSRDKGATRLIRLRKDYDRLYVSAVAKYEVFAGASDECVDYWQSLFESYEILPFDDAAIEKARALYRPLKRKNCLLDLGDILIAATAIVNDLPLATLNQRHFERIDGLRLIF